MSISDFSGASAQLWNFLEFLQKAASNQKSRKKLLTNRLLSVIILHVPRGNAAGWGSIAQLGEHLPYKQRVTGSSPVVPTIIRPGSSVGLECQPVTLEVEGSSPFRVAIFALVAQSVEHVTENHSVGGSIPPQGTFDAVVAQLVERHLAKVEVASPSLVYRSIFSGAIAKW